MGIRSTRLRLCHTLFANFLSTGIKQHFELEKSTQKRPHKSPPDLCLSLNKLSQEAPTIQIKQVSWLTAHGSPAPSHAFAQWRLCRIAPRSQWPDRPGLPPGSLLPGSVEPALDPLWSYGFSAIVKAAVLNVKWLLCFSALKYPCLKHPSSKT